MKRVAIIMAGGVGERFWPLSRINRPKQLLYLSSLSRNMLQEAIDRINGFIAVDDIYIITSKVLQNPIRDALPELPPQNIIAEPYKRNTAPCLALASSILLSKYGYDNAKNIVVSVLTADQVIEPKDLFLQSLDKLNNYCAINDTIATIGIIPKRPETGFGYIEFDKDLKDDTILKGLKFHEKPDYEKALSYLQQGNFLWNSGMFFYRLDYFNNEMRKYLPEIGIKIDDMAEMYINKTDYIFNGSNPDIDDIFERFPDISIDNGIMEKTSNVSVMKSIFNWDDLGTWDSLFRVRLPDENGNIIEGNVEIDNVINSLIINKASKRFISTSIGLDGVAIINTDDSLLVTPINNSQNVKNIVKILRANNKTEWL